VYVGQENGDYVVSGTRVSLDSIVYAFLAGQTAEAIGQAFPVLALEQVYGAITFYLGNKAEAEQDLPDRRRIEDEYSRANPAPPEIKEKFERMRQQTLARQS